LLAAGALFILASRARADVPNPLRIAVVFEQAGQPYTGPVRFTITCYGYSYPAGPDPDLAPGSYTPKRVYTLAGACAGAGCTLDEDLYLNYRHFDSCDLQGDAGGVRFQVKNYAQRPIDLSTCGPPTGSDDRRLCELRIALPGNVALPTDPQDSASPAGYSTGVPAAPSDPALAPTAPQDSASPVGRNILPTSSSHWRSRSWSSCRSFGRWRAVCSS
jgi:hypothetical protein